MLLLHTAFKSAAFVLFSPLFFVSCSNDSKKDVEIIKALNESIENLNKWLEQSNNDLLIALNDKHNDPSTADRAKYWYPKGELAHKISKEAFEFIEALKRKLISGDEVEDIDVSELFKKLINYKAELLSIDSIVSIKLNKTLLLFTQSIDS